MSTGTDRPAHEALADALADAFSGDAVGRLTDLVEQRLAVLAWRPHSDQMVTGVVGALVELLREEAGGHYPRVWLAGETPPPDTTVLAGTGDVLRWEEDTDTSTAGPDRTGLRDSQVIDLDVTTALVEVRLPDWQGAVDAEIVRRSWTTARVPRLRPVSPTRRDPRR